MGQNSTAPLANIIFLLRSWIGSSAFWTGFRLKGYWSCTSAFSSRIIMPSFFQTFVPNSCDGSQRSISSWWWTCSPKPMVKEPFEGLVASKNFLYLQFGSSIQQLTSAAQISRSARKLSLATYLGSSAGQLNSAAQFSSSVQQLSSTAQFSSSVQQQNSEAKFSSKIQKQNSAAKFSSKIQ